MTDFNEAQGESVRGWNDHLARPLTLHFLKTLDERTQEFEDFLQNFIKLAPNVDLVVDYEGEGGPPAIRMGSSLSYHAVPVGGELNPFLEILSLIAGAAIPEELQPLASKLGELQLPADIKVYVAPGCPFCPQTLKQLAVLPIISPIIHMTVIDGVLFPEMAREDAVRSVPTVILDGRMRWTGSVPMDEFISALFERDPVRLSAGALKDFIKEGNAVALAELMLARGQVFQSFPELLADPEWPVRLGAMVVVEELSGANREMAFLALEPLWDRLGSMDPSVRGDILYLFGTLAPSSWVHRFEALLELEESPDVREVLVEALEKVRPGGE